MNPQKILIEKIFDKAKSESGSTVLTQQAKYIANKLDEDFGFLVTDKALRNYYNDFLKNGNSNTNIRSEIADYLSKFLGYDNFITFTKEHVKIKGKPKNSIGKRQKVIIATLAVLTSYFGYDSITSKCMIWKDNKYEKINCKEPNTIPIDNILLDNFIRVEPNCNYPFFKQNGGANLWYGKSVNGDYEYFTYLGLHPVTGKTLKEITSYIIKNHICETY